MGRRVGGLRRSSALLALAFSMGALAACGSSSSGGTSSSSSSASSLLKQTFTGVHTVNSGNLTLNLTLNPSGSSSLTGPIVLNFGGPFQSRGAGKLPASNFTVSISALGKSGSIGILSTGTGGYVTYQGTSYRLPAATFQRLESSFSQLASSSGGSSGTGGLSSLGIDPQHWLVNPSVVGAATVGGAQTTHIRASVDVAALLGDLDTLLHKASALGVSGASRIPQSIPAATRARIASEVKHPAVDIWTGNSDKTLRKLAVNMTVPVTGQASSLLGGLTSSGIGLTLQYGALNQPQTIVAPTKLRPYSQFQAELNAYLGEVQSALGGGAGTAATSTGSGTATNSAAAAANLASYSQCIKAAGTDVSKMQRCAPLLNKK